MSASRSLLHCTCTNRAAARGNLGVHRPRNFFVVRRADSDQFCTPRTAAGWIAACVGAMNIAAPVSSAITGVEFGFLGPEEIKALSVKCISNPATFDTLLHPVPGGLYDPALGAFLDNP